MKISSCIGLFLMVLSLVSCGEYKTTDDGVRYKVLSYGENQDLKPEIGDIMTLSVVFRNNDTLINQFVKTDIQLIKKASKGDLWSGFTIMSKGDSITFVITAKQFYNELTGGSVPQGIADDADIFVDVKMYDFSKESEYLERKTSDYERKETETLNKYLGDNNITVEPTASGLYFISLEKGKGKKAEVGKMIVANYTGTFLDGRKFDSSYDRNEPFEFVLGEGSVIKAWDEAFSNMSVGDIATIIVPSKLAYGANGVQVAPGKYMIEPYTPLLFDVQLVDVKAIDPKKVNTKKSGF